MGLARRAVRLGVPPAWLRHRWVDRVDLDAVARDPTTPAPQGVQISVVHSPTIERHALPRNVADREHLPDDRGWWGYSMRDVPERHSGPTFVATIQDATIASYRDDDGDYHPAVLDRRRRSLDLREVRFRPPHAEVLHRAPVQHLERATWVLERVHHNHSHWLTAHLPKLLVLRDRGLLDDLVLPRQTTPVMDETLRWLGLDPEAVRRVDTAAVLRVDELTLVGNDRFRPELLRWAREAAPDLVPGGTRAVRRRRIYVSRARAQRRRLVGEPEVEALLADAGFESVVLEDLAFADQVTLMQQTEILCGPHGAGLTNMLFCPPGAHVVEFADLGFPNPNFYAMSAALGHHHWLLDAQAVGDEHPLERNMRIDLEVVADTMNAIDTETARRRHDARA